jgi:hypothetical protein
MGMQLAVRPPRKRQLEFGIERRFSTKERMECSAKIVEK